jgi:cytohesin
LHGLVVFTFVQQALVFKAEGILRQQLKRLENCTHRDDSRLTMKSQLIAIVAAVLLVGCGPSVDIHQAAELGNIELVKQHLDAGMNVNAKLIKLGMTTPLHQAAYGGYKEVVELLIAKGADVNAKDDHGQTPLHRAAHHDHGEIAELLIAEGADVNAENKRGGTLLHNATEAGNKEIVELLIAKGADVNAQLDDGPGKGETPVDVAIVFKHPEIADLLRKHGGKTGEELKAEEK